MPTNPIPERDPVGDNFTGSLLKIGDSYLLALGSPPNLETIMNGALMVRYAVPYLGRPQLSIVPGIIALDYGDMLTGEEAWIFLTQKSNLHPRADVVGYRNDGHDDMIVVKKLDLAMPVEVLVYADANATQPLASIDAVIAPETAPIPKRLNNYLPRFDTIAAWQADRENNE